jgi:hypothetical protein
VDPQVALHLLVERVVNTGARGISEGAHLDVPHHPHHTKATIPPQELFPDSFFPGPESPCQRLVYDDYRFRLFRRWKEGPA